MHPEQAVQLQAFTAGPAECCSCYRHSRAHSHSRVSEAYLLAGALQAGWPGLCLLSHLQKLLSLPWRGMVAPDDALWADAEPVLGISAPLKQSPAVRLQCRALCTCWRVVPCRLDGQGCASRAASLVRPSLIASIVCGAACWALASAKLRLSMSSTCNTQRGSLCALLILWIAACQARNYICCASRVQCTPSS